MTVRELRRFQLTCDGHYLWRDSWGEWVPTECRTTATALATDLDDLCNIMIPDGWSQPYGRGSEELREILLCPRADHLPMEDR